MNEILLLSRRSVREVIRLPAATIPTLFIPLFFLAVNIGQISKTFPSTTPFLHGQGYVGFQLPVSMMFAVCTATSGLALVTEIEGGYFDKLLVAPIRRSSMIFGRLAADLVRGLAVATLVLLVALAFGMQVRAGIVGAVVLIVLAALWGVAYAGIGMLVALHTRNVQATNASFLVFFPLLFLTPNFVPFERLYPADGGARSRQPGELCNRRTALARARRLGHPQARDLRWRDPRRRRRAHVAVGAGDRALRPLRYDRGLGARAQPNPRAKTINGPCRRHGRPAAAVTGTRPSG